MNESPAVVNAPYTYLIHANQTITANGSQVISGLGDKEVELVVNVKGSISGTDPTLKFSFVEVDEQDLTTETGYPEISCEALGGAGGWCRVMGFIRGSAIKIKWTVGGTNPSFGGVYSTVVSRASNSLHGKNQWDFTPSTYASNEEKVIDDLTPLLTDCYGQLVTRGDILTDEGCFRDDFSFTALTWTITGNLTFAKGSRLVTGSGTAFMDELGMEYIRHGSDTDDYAVRIQRVLSQNRLLLVEPYTGTSGVSNSAKALNWLNLTAKSPGAAVTVANSVATLDAGSNGSGYAEIVHWGDYLPMAITVKLKLTGRGGTARSCVGFVSNPSAAYASWEYGAWIMFDGTDATKVKLVSRYDSYTDSVETTQFTLPNGWTTGDYHVYVIDVEATRITLSVDGVLLGTHVTHIIDPYWPCECVAYVGNISGGASEDLMIDSFFWSNHDTVNIGNEIGSSVTAVQKMASEFNATVVGNKSNNSTVPSSTNVGALAGVATASAPTYSEGNQVGLSTDLSGQMRILLPKGQTTMADSLPVTLASDQPAQTVTGTKTHNSAAPGSNNVGSIPAIANASAPTFVEGNQVALSTDLSGGLRVSGASLLAQDATLTGGTQKAIARGGAKGATTAADLTSTAEGADHQSLDVQIYHGGAAKDPTQIRALTSSDVVTSVGNKTHNAAAPGATNVGSLPALANASAPTLSEGYQVSLSTDLSGGLRVSGVSSLALDATLTGGTQKAIARGGAKGSTTAADVTGTAEGTDHQALDVQLYHGGTAKDPTQIRALASATDSVEVKQATASNLNVTITGSVAHDSPDTGNPVKHGGKARIAAPAAISAEGDRVDGYLDKYGRTVVSPHGTRDTAVQQQTTITNSTSETTILTAVASTFLDLVQLVITNRSGTACYVTIKDATTGTTRMILAIAANGGIVVPFQIPVPQAAVNNNWTATLSVNTVTVDIFALAVKNV